MELNSECKECKTFQDQIYWKHFTSIHFFLTLPSNFQDHLVLPEKFSAHKKDLFPEHVSLKGPSGTLWDIELLKSDDLILVGNGWKDFVKANNLKENCLLVFKYERSSSFEVLIVDGGSFCEKESAYFVTKCAHIQSDHEDQEKRIVREASRTEVIEYDSEEDAVFSVSKRPCIDDGGLVCSGDNMNTLSPEKDVLHAGAKRRGRPRKGKDRSSDEIIKDVSQDLMITPENTENYLVKDGSQIIKGQAAAKRRGKPRKEKEPSSNDISEELSQDMWKEPVTPKTSENSLEDCSLIFKGQADDLTGRVTSERSVLAKKLPRISGRKVNLPDYRESSPEEDRISNSHRKRGRPMKQLSPSSPQKLMSKSVSRNIGYPKEYMSNRRPVTEMEKEKTLQRANENQTEDSFTSVMRPSYVYKKFFLNIPSEWSNKHRLQRNQKVVLRVGNNTWHTVFATFRNRVSGLSTGWKRFALENFLEEFDVLVFKPVKVDEAAVVLDVDIFRVVATIIPPSLSRIGCPKEYMSNRCPVTEMEKANALQRAKENQTEDSFTTVMRPSYVYKKFFLNIPNEWLKKHCLQRNQKVVLRVGNNAWHTVFKIFRNRASGLSAGWMRFALENFLEEFDVLVFKPVKQVDEAAVVLDVDIFRVVATIISPSREKS